MQELITRKQMEECRYCKEKEKRFKSYEEEIEWEKIRECQKALEKEKLGKGKPITKEEEIKLREMQKIQMKEKKRIEEEYADVEKMWHQVLVDDVKQKEIHERLKLQRRNQEMVERRKAYDDQIASANRKRQEALREEREKENRRFERITKKIQEDRFEEIKRKKEQQSKNKQNFIEGYQIKAARLEEERRREREIDDSSIRKAMEDLRTEEMRKIDQMHDLQKQKQVCEEYQCRERQMALALQREAEAAAAECRKLVESRADDAARISASARLEQRKKAQEDYQRHVERMREEISKEREERAQKMETVKKMAVEELHKKLEGATEELRRQIVYRKSLNEQIRDNQKALETQTNEIETKQRPFTKEVEMFEDKMRKIDKTLMRESTNPVHPFRRAIEKQKESSCLQLPLIGRTFNKYNII